MPQSENLAPLIPPLHDLVTWLSSSGVPFVIVGGVAAALQGRPRATRDIDAVIMIEENAWSAFLADAAAHGFPPRRKNSLEFAAVSRVLLLQHARSGLGIDLSLGAMPFEREMITRASRVFVEGVHVPLASPEDLIVMKSLAMRPNDITDIVSLVEANKNINLARVRKTVGMMGEALDEPELLSRLEAVLPTKRKPIKRSRKRPSR